ncbi:hypothetical protein PR048_003868 [Dryococelus australis]|uniref:Uncharacterized protein n=1 Tax=Dryococelus australis TaxID=614101 RepID=A0ABQ9IQU4_9NEOP|nr:hypothetical protein PR048_003868 [Dryococelus australis]
MLTSNTLIGSQDLAVKSRPNFFTHSLYYVLHINILETIFVLEKATEENGPLCTEFVLKAGCWSGRPLRTESLRSSVGLERMPRYLLVPPSLLLRFASATTPRHLVTLMWRIPRHTASLNTSVSVLSWATGGILVGTASGRVLEGTASDVLSSFLLSWAGAHSGLATVQSCSVAGGRRVLHRPVADSVVVSRGGLGASSGVGVVCSALSAVDHVVGGASAVCSAGVTAVLQCVAFPGTYAAGWVSFAAAELCCSLTGSVSPSGCVRAGSCFTGLLAGTSCVSLNGLYRFNALYPDIFPYILE